mmetsp:Transcript_16959/g.29585  ORF Transcript_16959/g.29585 Transcript_16959/m.29585 type:complete len:144 (+) Transcript_16959:59-490(+)
MCLVQVCDFGLARLKLDTSERESKVAGSPFWSAPEVLRGEAIFEKADTFSYGMLCFELMSRQLPYPSVSAPEVSIGVATNMLPRPQLPDTPATGYPAELVNLMEKCWLYEPAERPAFNEILDHLERIAEVNDVGRLNLGVAAL